MSKKKPIKTRDPLMVRLINGATKSGTHKDRKKEADKVKARKKVECSECPRCGLPFEETLSSNDLCWDCRLALEEEDEVCGYE